MRKDTDFKISSPALVSVIVPIFNAEKYIQRCINSILNQTYQSIEVILIDDGSSDSSKKLCDYFRADRRINVYSQLNRGPLATRVAGVELCHGEWIFFVDADDYLHTNELESLISMTDDSVDIVIAGGKRDRIFDAESFAISLLSFHFWPLWGKLYRKTLFKKGISVFPLNVTMAEDFLANLALLNYIEGNIIVTQTNGYVHNNRNNKSISNLFRSSFEYERLIIEQVETIIRKYLVKHDLNYCLCYQYFHWRMEYLSGFIGLGYKVQLQDPWLQTLIEESSLYHISLKHKIALKAIKYPQFRFPFLLEKKLKLFFRSVKNYFS